MITDKIDRTKDYVYGECIICDSQYKPRVSKAQSKHDYRQQVCLACRKADNTNMINQVLSKGKRIKGLAALKRFIYREEKAAAEQAQAALPAMMQTGMMDNDK